MDYVFASISLVLGVGGALFAILSNRPDVSVVALTTGGGASGAPALQTANKYQLYLFVSEFLRGSDLALPRSGDAGLTHFEFYRIVYKLVKPMVGTKK